MGAPLAVFTARSPANGGADLVLGEELGLLCQKHVGGGAGSHMGLRRGGRCAIDRVNGEYADAIKRALGGRIVDGGERRQGSCREATAWRTPKVLGDQVGTPLGRSEAPPSMSTSARGRLHRRVH